MEHTNLYKFGSDNFILFHHCRGSSTDSTICKYFLTFMTIGSSGIIMFVCFAANSNRNFLIPRNDLDDK